jgi:hypothetical protein
LQSDQTSCLGEKEGKLFSIAQKLVLRKTQYKAKSSFSFSLFSSGLF